MTIDYRIISTGAFGAHPLWDEKDPVRPDHATTTLIIAGDEKIIVDPSLPPDLLLPRMAERCRVRAQQVTHVFLTSMQPVRRRGITAFDNARWLAMETEIDAARASIDSQFTEARETGEAELLRLIESEKAVLDRLEPADDAIAPGVDLFPMPGVTTGTCGLLLSLPGSTVLVCGDAAPSVDHLHQGKVLGQCVDIERAQESFREAIEIADAFILGRDGLALNPVRGGIGAPSLQ